MVSDEERNSMKHNQEALNGNSKALKSTSSNSSMIDDDLSGPGQVSPKAINAMADILTKLNNVSDQVVTDSRFNPQLDEAIHTQRTSTSVKVGNYEIMIKEDANRIAGKQFYGIYNTVSGDIIADDITLYETAILVVKSLNSGKYTNSSLVRNLFEADDRYTAHRTDAISFKSRARSAERRGDYNKSEIFESRFQSSVVAANAAKTDIKRLVAESRQKKR